MPTALTVQGENTAFVQQVADVLHGPEFRAYTGSDMRGAELGGAMKNVLAVATGAADGMQLGLNARTGLITRGLNEMLRLNAAIGGRPETLMGLAGLGDLVRSEEHTSELQSLMRIPYAVFCLKKKTKLTTNQST